VNYLTPRIKLWGEEEVRDLLNPGKMSLGSVADKKALHYFLAKSEKADFKYNEQWTRMLTLEYTLHALGKGTFSKQEIKSI